MTIQVKINTSNQTLESIQIAKGELIIIQQPMGKVSFELVDLETGLAPQSIIAKRVGVNLEIAFNDDVVASLVIEGYYNNEETSPLLGLAENGEYYTYVPASGVSSDSIPALSDNILATEVLGGENSSPIAFFAGWPWLVAGAAAALLSTLIPSNHKGSGVNLDVDNDGKLDSDELAKAQVDVEAAKEADKALKDAVKAAEEDGVITPEEKADIEEKATDAAEKKDQAQKSVDELPNSMPEKADLADEVAKLDGAKVNDADNDGKVDSNELAKAQADVAAAKEADKALKDAVKAAEEDGVITSEEKADIEAKAKDAADKKATADASVKELPDTMPEKADLADEVAKLDGAKVNDADNDGKVDGNELAKAQADVAAAKEADKALKDAVKAAEEDGVITPEEKADIEAKAKDAADKKATADASVKELPDTMPEKADLADEVAKLDGAKVNDADNDGKVDGNELAKAQADVEAAKAADKAAKDALAKANEDGKITPAEKAELERLKADADEKKAKAEESVNELPDTMPEKADLNGQLQPLDNIVVPAVNDEDADGKVDTDELAKARADVEAAKEADKALKDAVKAAEEDGVITPEEKADIEAKAADAAAKKDQAQKSVDELPNSMPEKADLADEVAKLDGAVVNDADNDGKVDSNELAKAQADLEAAKAADKALKDAVKAAEEDGVITPEEKADIEAKAADAAAKKDQAQKSVDELPNSMPEKADLADEVAKLDGAKVNDADNDGKVDSNELAKAQADVEAAKAADKAAKDALAKANEDGKITPEEKAELEGLKADADAKKAKAQESVNELPSPSMDAEKAGLNDQIQPLDGIVVPAVTDADADGNLDADELTKAQADVEAAKEADKVLKDAVKAAEEDGVITPEEKADIEAKATDAAAKKDQAQKSVDELPNSMPEKADLADEVAKLDGAKVNDADNDGKVDGNELAKAQADVEAAKAAEKAAEDALKEAQSDGKITPAERENLENLNNAAAAAKQTAQDSVNELPTPSMEAEKADLNNQLQPLDGIVVPAVNDEDADGKVDTDELAKARADVEAAKEADKALKDAVKAAEADGEITPAEKADIEAKAADAAEKKATAEASVNDLPASMPEKSGLAEEVAALDGATINDADNDGKVDAAELTKAQADVEAAKVADKAAKDELAKANADGKITPEEKAELDRLKADADAKKAKAQESVNDLPSPSMDQEKAALNNQLQPLDGIVVPAVNDADADGKVDADELAKARADVEAAKAAEKAAEDALKEAQRDGKITPAERENLENLNNAAAVAKQTAQDSVNELPTPSMEAEKADLNNQLQPLDGIVVPEVNDADADGKVDADELAKAQADVTAAKEADKALKDAVKAAEADGEITPAEKADIEAKAADAAAKKDQAQKSVDELPNSMPEKTSLNDELAALDGATVNDADNDGKVDANELAKAQADIEAAKVADKAAKDALAQAEQDGKITPAERANLEAKKSAAEQAKAVAQASVNELPNSMPEKAQLNGELANLNNIVVPAVTDADADGKLDADELAQARRDVEAAKAAEKAAEDALKEANRDGKITPEERQNLERLNNAAAEAKATAQNSVNELPSTMNTEKADLNGQLQPLDGIDVPAVNDADADGKLDTDELAQARRDVEAAKAAEKAAEDALKEANKDGVITPEERQNLERLNNAVTAAKAKAQESVNELPSTMAAEKAELNGQLQPLDGIVVPSASTPTATPTVAVKSINLEPQGNKTPEKVEITGTTTPNAVVKLLDSQGQPLRDTNGQEITATANNRGEFVIKITTGQPEAGEKQVTAPIATASPTADYKVSAKAPNHIESSPANVNVEDVPRGSSTNPNDTTAPALTAATDGSKVVFKLPKNTAAANGDANKVAAEGDIITLTDANADGRGTEVIAKFEYKNGSWQPVAGTNNKAGVTVGTVSEGGKEFHTFSLKAQPAQGGVQGLAVNDKVKAQVEDFAGRTAQAEATAPDPKAIDPVKIYAGVKTAEHADDAENATRLKLNVGDIAAENINAGDVYILAGADNNKVKIDFVAVDAAYNAQTETYPLTTLWAVKGRDGNWALYTNEQGTGNPATQGSVVTLPQSGDGKQYIKLNADKVKDLTQVTAQGFDEDNNRTEPVSVMTDFDDVTESTVATPAVTQPNAGDILLTPPAKDAVTALVEFMAPAAANSYGLSTGKNFLVAYKVPNQQGNDSVWQLGHIRGDSATIQGASDKEIAKTGSELAVDPSRFATIDPTTGKITLKKDFVQTGSAVKTDFLDAFGNFASGADFNTTHTNATVPEFVDAPDLISLGNGLMEVRPGVPDGDASGQLNGSDFKTVVTHKGGNITVKFVPASGTTPARYELEGINNSQYTAKGIESFDPETGVLILKGNDTDPVTAYARKMKNNTEHRSDTVSDNIVAKDITDTTADVAEVEALTNGNVNVQPGLDNKKVEVTYTKPDGSKVTATLEKQPDGSWQAKAPNAADFEGTTLKASAVKDGTQVTAVGIDGAPTPNRATPYSTFALVDDATPNAADAPRIQNKAQANADSTHDIVIGKGGDNGQFTVLYTPRGQAGTLKSLVSKLQKDGSWALTDDTGRPVPEAVATVNPTNGEITLKHLAVEGRSPVKATGYNSAGISANAQDHTADAAPASGGGSAPSQPHNHSTSLMQLRSISDGELQGWAKYSHTKYLLKYKVYDAQDGQVKDAVLEVGKGSDSSRPPVTLYVNGQRANEVDGINLSLQTITSFDGQPVKNWVAIVKSGARYKLLADSPAEPKPVQTGPMSEDQARGTVNDQLGLQGWYNKDKATVDRTNPAHDARMILLNLGSSSPSKVEKTTTMPTMDAMAANAGTDPNKGQGAMKLNPHANHDKLYVEYVKESGEQGIATLSKASNGSWSVTYGDANDFHIEGSNIYIKPDSLKDNHQNGVILKGAEPNKLASDQVQGTPLADPVNPPPRVPELVTGLNTLLTSANVKEAGEDVARRATALSIEKGYKELEAFFNLNRDKGTFTWDKNADNGYGLTTINLNGDTGLNIRGSLGDTKPQAVSNYLPRVRKLTINGSDQNNVININNDLGENDNPLKVKDSLQKLDLRGGNDVLLVGTANRWFKLKENPNTKYAKDQYDIVAYGDTTNTVEAAENDRLAKRVGGRIVGAEVDMGDGNDLVAVEGLADGNAFAITDSAVVNLGRGNDVLLIAPAAIREKTLYARGMIGNGSQVDAGDGNDFVKAVGVENAQLKLGAGDDTAELIRLLGSNTVVDAGSGNDHIILKGEARSGAKILLGDGDDVFEFGGGDSIFGASGKHALFEGFLDGGSGYDVVKLVKPKEPDGTTFDRGGMFNQNETNFSSRNFKNIEEFVMGEKAALDISYKDLLVDNVNGPIKVRKDVGVNQAVVDLGRSNLNGETGNVVGTGVSPAGEDHPFGPTQDTRHRWKKVGSPITEDGITYDVYLFDSDSSNAMWIQQGITVI